MTGSIERVLSPEEVELQRYLDEIERLKSDIATRLAELESYKAELARFSAEYHTVLGPLFAELDRVELEIAAYRRKIELLQSDPEITAEQIDDVVENEFRAQHERIRQEEEENRAYERAWDREQQRPKLSDDDVDELKRVYRELAKKHHPDFAVDAQDRIEREASMQKINNAFAKRNLLLLRSMKGSLQDHAAAFEKKSIGDKLVWAIREVARLKHRLSTVQRDISDLHATSTSNLVSFDQSQPGVIVRSSAELRVQIRQKQRVLANLKLEANRLAVRGKDIS